MIETMSASQKKKLRNEQKAAQLTEKQIQAAKEAKQLRLYTILFTAAIAVMICVVVFSMVFNSGIIERNTVAVTVGDSKISATELNHYYIDTINAYASQYGSYMSLILGIDTTTALDEQYVDEETGKTWADQFLEEATTSIHNIYSVYNEAKAAGYTLSNEDKSEINHVIASLKSEGLSAGFTSVSEYIAAVYGKGCNEETYRDYMGVQIVASNYATDYNESLTYTAEQLREADEADPKVYNSYSYNYYDLYASRFRTGGTTAEDGTTTYSDEEKAAAIVAAEEAAKSLVVDEIDSVEALDEAIAALPVNAEAESAASTANKDITYGSINATIQEWVTDPARQVGDKTYIARESTSTNEDGTEVTTVTGYCVVYFNGVNDNTYPMNDVRHILVSLSGGTTDTDGNVTYSDEEKAEAKEKAEAILAEFLAGDATEDSFAALAMEKSTDTGSKADGGLIANIVPTSSYVESFRSWAVDESRKPGDTGIVESSYGYHVMYFVGDTEQTYRDYMITNDLISADLTQWQADVMEAHPLTVVDASQCRTDLVLSSGS